MQPTLVLLFVFWVSSVFCSIPPPERFSTFLLGNRWESGLPLSYYPYPDYFNNVPASERPNYYTEGEYEPQCNNQYVSAEDMNAYQFQTEELLTVGGLNLYDGAIWAMAVSLLDPNENVPIAEQYHQTTLVEHRTLQFPNIKGDAVCKGVIEYGDCKDSEETGSCGFCYGDATNKTLDTDNAYFFRMISDVWGYDGANDVRCPMLNGQPNSWKWNDYRPVTGENAWANVIGPLQVAYIKAGKNVDNIPDDSQAFTLALNFIPAIEMMLIVNHGAIYYAPRNTWDTANPSIGDSVSTENNASLLAGLKMLLYILQTRGSRTYDQYIPRVQNLVGHITNYLHSAYNFQYGYFSQGASNTGNTNQWTWVKEPFFAVDCQTWVITVLGREVIDGWFGEGTSMNIWNKTKQIGGYQFDSNSAWARGVGFSDNTDAQVFSGEWSLGAINMLYVLAYSYPDDSHERQALIAEAEFMRQAIEIDLVKTGTLDGQAATAIYYTNKRYFIPFGWYGNPIWSTASTGWAVTNDLSFNPFYLGGDYLSAY
jgi:hypothetical protein